MERSDAPLVIDMSCFLEIFDSTSFAISGGILASETALANSAEVWNSDTILDFIEPHLIQEPLVPFLIPYEVPHWQIIKCHCLVIDSEKYSGY